MRAVFGQDVFVLACCLWVGREVGGEGLVSRRGVESWRRGGGGGPWRIVA